MKEMQQETEKRTLHLQEEAESQVAYRDKRRPRSRRRDTIHRITIDDGRQVDRPKRKKCLRTGEALDEQ
jgi:hypothetical protein